VYFTGINKSTIPSEDTLPAVFLPISIICDRDFYLDEFVPYFTKNYHDPDDFTKPSFYLKKIDSHYVSAFPVVAPVLAVPIYLIPTVFIEFSENSLWVPFLAKLSAATFASLSSVFIFLSLKEVLSKYRAFFLSLIYATGTCTYAISSQGLWQHAPSQMFLSMAIYFILRGLKVQRLVPYAGLMLSLATLTRPPNFVIAFILTIYVLFRHRKKFLSFALLAIMPVVLWSFYNKVYFGSFFKQAYDETSFFKLWWGRFPEGFLGLWLSPSKGLLVYSPIFIFSILGVITIFKNKKVLGNANFLFRVFALIVLVMTFIMGKWYHWYGGWSFGYRMAVDITPFLIMLIVPLVHNGLIIKFSRLKLVFLVFCIYSVFVQLLGVIHFDGEWHARFDDGPKDTAWLWSVRNSEIVYYIKKGYCKISASSDKEYIKCQGLQQL